MARILSGADFGVVMPRGYNPNFGADLSAQLLGQAMGAIREEATQTRRLENLQTLEKQRNELLSKAEAEKTRLNLLYTEVDRIKNMDHSPAKRAAIAKLGISEFNAGRDGSEFIEALKFSTPDEFNMNLDRLSDKAGVLAGQVERVLKQNDKTSGFESIVDEEGNVIAQRNLETGEVKADPRASKLFSAEEMAQKMALIEGRARATVAEQQNTPQAKLALELGNERLKELQQNRKLQAIEIEEDQLQSENEKKEASEVKQIRFREATSSVEQIDRLLEGRAFEKAFGKAVTATPELLRSQEAIDAIANVDQIRALLSLESRQKLKGSGTISDNEQKTLEKSATVLANPLISADLAEEELIKVKRIFEDAARRNRVAEPENIVPEISEGATATNRATGEKIIFRGGQWQPL